MDDPNRTKRISLLPHEWAFSGFLLLTSLRLLVAGDRAVVWSFAFLAQLAASIAVIVWASRRPSPGRWRVRLVVYPVAMGVSFYAMKYAVPLLGNPNVDAMLLAWDRALLGETPALAWQNQLHPWLVEVAMAGYLFFFYYLIAGPARYCVRDLELFRKCIVGLFTMYALSFLGYSFFPAGGPHRFTAFTAPLDGGWLLDWTLRPVNSGSNGVDVFPSVHFGATLYLLGFDWWHHRRRFWWVLPPCGVLWFSTLYLRFHYFVDLLAGAAVALAGLAIARWHGQATLDVETRTKVAFGDSAGEEQLRASHHEHHGEQPAHGQRREPAAAEFRAD